MTHPRFNHLSLLLMLAVGAGCGSGSSATTSTLSGADCSQSVPTYSELTIWPLCTVCHSSSLSGSARQGAPANVNFDSYAAAARAAGEAVTEVSAGRMPPSGETQPASAETAALEQWAQCGTPE